MINIIRFVYISFNPSAELTTNIELYACIMYITHLWWSYKIFFTIRIHLHSGKKWISFSISQRWREWTNRRDPLPVLQNRKLRIKRIRLFVPSLISFISLRKAAMITRVERPQILDLVGWIKQFLGLRLLVRQQTKMARPSLCFLSNWCNFHPTSKGTHQDFFIWYLDAVPSRDGDLRASKYSPRAFLWANILDICPRKFILTS